MSRRLRRAWGLLRSLAIYHGQFWREGGRRDFYRQFLPPGGLGFDVGAHLGDRVRTWRALGARVVAVEPQPDCLAVLRALYGRDEGVTVVPAGLGPRPGRAVLHLSEATPTLSTLSPQWIADVTARDARFAEVRWEGRLEVEVKTLDGLVARYGVPDFIKVDVEGHEVEVLRGLSRPVAALSFEYIPAVAERAVACVERLGALGRYEFRTSPVETMRWAQPRWLQADEVKAFLGALPVEGRSGDVYARQRVEGLDSR